MKCSTAQLVVALLFFGSTTTAFGLPVDFNSLTSHPVSSISVSFDGSTATFVEDTNISPVTLYGSLAVPSDGLSLSLQYFLNVGSGNEDYFDFYLNDLSVPTFSVGGSLGTYEAPLSFDLMAFRGTSVDFIFHLMAGLNDFQADQAGNLILDQAGNPIPMLGSQLVISNLNLHTQGSAPVPEPGTLLLMAAGLGGVLLWKKKVRA